jgi:SWI/SNF-related matrix-associated actin-dependent regulator 1 of chromatin subfamily A
MDTQGVLRKKLSEVIMEPMEEEKRIILNDDEIVLYSPYNSIEVTAVKQISGAKWDRLNKTWRVPVSSLKQIKAYAVQFDYWLDPDLRILDLPEHPYEKQGVELVDENLIIRFAYDSVKVAAIKLVAGSRWNTQKKAWLAPVSSLAQVAEFCQNFRLHLPDELEDIRLKILESQSERISASRAVDAYMEIPDMTGELLPYQRAGVRYITDHKRVFLADEMGLGKSVQSLAAVQHQNAYPCLIVCPPNLALNWATEIDKFFPTRTWKRVVTRSDFPEESTDFTIVGYSNIDFHPENLKGYTSYIFDESHYLKNPKAKRTKRAQKLAKTASKNGLVLCLTGTPITNRPAEYGPQLEIVGRLKEFGGLWAFYKRYCGAFRDRFNQWHIDGASNLDELNDRLRGSCYIRRTKDQVLKDLPPIRHSEWMIDPDPKYLKEYQKAEEDIVKFVTERAAQLAKELGQDPKSAAVRAKFKAEAHEHLIKLSVLKRIAAKTKLKAVDEWVESRINEGRKVVLAAHHREIVDILADQYGGLKIQGGMTSDAVEATKEKFMEQSAEDAPVLVLSIQAAKTGHTLTAAQDMLFVEHPWTPADVDQISARIHRIGTTGAVQITHALAAGTIDEKVYELINYKRAVVNAATEGTTEDLEKRNAGTLMEDFLPS